LLSRLGQFPTGARLSWVYEAGTAGTHPERWTMAERSAVLARVQQAASARGITVGQP
jgi:hypothetical protein